jgi:hypothetical protein
MSVEVQDNRAKLDAILREVHKLAGAVVTVGVHGDNAQRKDDSETNPEIGAKHEFGSGHIPERSFLRSTVDSGKPMEFAEQVSAKVARGQMTADRAAQQIGVVTVGEVKQTIAAKIPPPLSEQTIQRRLEKGAHGGGLASLGNSTTPLVDTGQLVQSIQYRVEGV